MSVPLPSSLIDAVASGDLEETNAILGSDSSLDINWSVDIVGRNLLHIACIYSHIDLVRLFIGMGLM
jgi:ankyrin repeat protein